ncbi:hypothetical protein A2U01_0104894, partial [Trifolium medium]|nr:hypothetical protein [Trifolium medium]
PAGSWRFMIFHDRGPWWRSSSTGECHRLCRGGGEFLLGERLLGEYCARLSSRRGEFRGALSFLLGL